jgi:hypothetical protein
LAAIGTPPELFAVPIPVTLGQAVVVTFMFDFLPELTVSTTLKQAEKIVVPSATVAPAAFDHRNFT